MKVHFIAIGGSAMHNMAIALHKKEYDVSGSDDEIFEPSKSRLDKYHLLPPKWGWFPEKINFDISEIVLGMHAREDNPELIKAKELGIKIFSYPEYIYEQSKDKTRVVIGGSHGKTTITAIILHILNYHHIDCDYMVGAQLAGFDTMVKLTKEAPIIILEGDEYLSSPIDRRPKFHLYHANIGLVSGIAWDHINVFPTFENYVEQFQIFVDTINENGSIIYFEDDNELKKVVEKTTNKTITKLSYTTPSFVIESGISYLLNENEKIKLSIFGKHNLQNIAGAMRVCSKLGVSNQMFLEAIGSFNGASKRLELVKKGNTSIMFKDFAHSPSKLKATTAAVKSQFPDRKLIACMELHTFSSLNENFLLEYKNSMDTADTAIVYYNPHTIEHKKLKPITIDQVKQSFDRKDLQVFTDSNKLQNFLLNTNWNNTCCLMMSSGTFDGIDFKELAGQIIQ